MSGSGTLEGSEKPGKARLKRLLKTALKLAVSAGLLLFLATQLDLSAALDRIGNAHAGFLVAGVALLLTQGLISAIKWHVVLKADDCRVALLYLWKTYLIGMFLSLLLPTSFGGDIYRVYAVRGGAAGLSKGTSSVLFDRLTGLMALVTLAIVGSLCLADTRFVWPVAAGYVLMIAIGLVLTGDRMLRRLQHYKRGRLGFAVKVLESFNTYRKDRWCMAWVVVISLLFQTNIVVINTLYSAALGIDVSFWQLLMVVPLVYLTETLPVSINGLGVRESAFVFFFQAIGQSAEAGLAVALLVVIFRYSTGLIGGALLIWDWLRNGLRPTAKDDGSAAPVAPQDSSASDPSTQRF